MSQPGQDNPGSRGEQERFFGAAKVVAVLTMISRVLGLLRDMVLVPLGSPLVADAFWLGFSVPHLFRRLFGEGALSAAFIPVFTEAAEKSGPARARMVLANTAGLLAVVLSGLVVLIELGLLAYLLAAPGPWDRQLTVRFTMAMLPFMLFICLLALCSAALNSHGHFAYPAAAPILLNVGLIAAGLWLAPAVARTDAGQFFIVSAAVVVCSIVQLVGAVWMLRRSGLAARWTLRPVLPEVRQIALRMAPTVVPLGMVQMCDFLGRLIAKTFTATAAQPDLPLAPGVVRCHYAAGRLYQLPMGVLGISLATVVFPLLSRCAARADRQGLRDVLNRALRLCMFLGIPTGVGLVLLAEPIVGVIFEKRDFSRFDTLRTARMLQMYCAAMPAYFCSHILLRTFFARKETRAPMVISAVMAAANVGIVFGGIFTPLRSAALGLATAVTATATAGVLAWVLHRRLGKLGWRRVLVGTLRVSAASAVMAGVVIATRWALASAGAGRLIVVIGCVVAGGAAFLAAAWLLRCEELGMILRRTERKAGGDSATMT
ncbi:MAG TPA: murein biosynthesis integral membrane protein MurJ [Phycisphaerae bacterium]|nr:murein biosynthesis integral membrane protein MurJ [Phycisphaerae bacterium]